MDAFHDSRPGKGIKDPLGASADLAVQRVIDALDRGGFDPRQTGAGKWESRCPGHDGDGHNLGISEGKDGRALLHCFAHECPVEAIAKPIGLQLRDLFPAASALTLEKPRAAKANAIAAKSDAKTKPKSPPFPSLADVEAHLTGKFGRPPTGSWDYRALDGTMAFRVYRSDFPKPAGGDPNAMSKEYRRVHPTGGGWRLGDPAGALPLYHLPDLAAADRVYVTEGEKCANLARDLGLVATTSAHGAQAAHKTDWSPLAGKMVIILPDVGEAGDDYVAAVEKQLAKLDPQVEVRVVRLPGLTRDGDDIEQFIQSRKGQGRSDEQIRAEIEGIAATTLPSNLGQDPADDADDAGSLDPEPDDDGPLQKRGRKGPSQVEILIELAGSATLFHTSDGRAYASVPVGDHREHYAVRSKVFKQWLAYQLYLARGTAPASEAMQQAISTLEARARFASPEEHVHLRVAGTEGPEGAAYYIDLADEPKRAVKITVEGWEVIADPPVKFLRPKTMLPLPVPQRGGSIGDLREFVNVGAEHDWRLFVALLCSYLRPTGPYPVLIVQGEQGSAKSTTTKIVSRLIDPIDCQRSTIRNEHELMIAAKNSWVVSSDNLSGLPAWLSDALCRVATGGGYAVRELYSDDEETVFKAMRPIVLNGIDDIANRPDLLDRSVVLYQPRISGDKRITERGLWARFDALAPKILGALLDAVAGGIRELPDVDVDNLPRMADFAQWGEAVGRGLGWGEGAFLDAYERNQGAANETAIEACPVATAIRAMMAEQPVWSGTATELMKCLARRFGDDVTTRGKEWPKTPRAMGDTVRRMAPALRKVGLEIEPDRTSKRRLITITRRSDQGGNPASAPSFASPDQCNHLSTNDLSKGGDRDEGSSSCDIERVRRLFTPRSSSVTAVSSPSGPSDKPKSTGTSDLRLAPSSGDDARDADDAYNPPDDLYDHMDDNNDQEAASA
jgi:hypothetical protein